MKNFYKVILFVFVTFFLSCADSNSSNENTLKNCQDDNDNDNDGKKDCEDEECQIFSFCMECIDLDGDNYGVNCSAGEDCDDTSITCNIECVLDTNNDGKRDCDEDCVDKDRDGYGDGEDCEDDCNDDDENNWTLCSQCKDNDNDGYYIMCNRYKTISGPDVDDNNPNCDIEATDSDNDEYCANHDCEDSLPECNIDCSDEDNDSIMDCNDCYNSPHEISHYFTHSQTSDIALKDNYVFLADGTNGLRIIDITDLKNPVETKVFGSDDWYVAVEGNYAYVAGSEGLRIINISQITSPREVGFLSFNRMFNDIIVRNNYVFLIEGTWGYEDENGFPYSYGGLQIVDVTDPEHPFEVSYYDTGGDANVLEITQIAGIDYAVVGVVKVTEDGTDITGGFSIIDLSNISAPNEINFQLLYPPDAMTIINGYLIINFFDFITPYNIIYDIVDPSSPQFVTEFIDDISIYALYSINDYLFAAGQGLIVYDLSSIESPQEIGSYTFEQGAFYNISYRDNHLFLSYFYIDWNEPNVYEGGLSIVSFLCGE